MRSQNPAGLAALAEDVATHVFRQHKLVPQLLIRDYARGIIECAQERCAIERDAFPESRPPYQSRWPDMRVPSAKALEKWGKWREDMPESEWPRSEIYSSVMGSEDFSRYVIGDLTEWTSVRLGTEAPPTPAQLFEQFMARLRPSQKKAVKEYSEALQNVHFIRRLPAEEQGKYLKRKFTGPELDAVLADAAQRLYERLGTPSLKRDFEAVAKSSLLILDQRDRSHPFDVQVARRWVLQRVIKYGWTSERFGEFDRMVTRTRNSGRESHKPERIGKKYQWIAYHELLARLTDNFYLRVDRYEDRGLREYSGPWSAQDRSTRDLDPSITIRRTSRDDGMAGRAWWSPVAYSGWQGHLSTAEWLRTADDLPPIEDCFSIQSPDGCKWYVLDTHLTRDQPAKPGRGKYELPQRNLWYIIRSYLVCRTDAAKFFRWAKKQDFMGRWMPEPGDVYHIFHGEFFWALAYRETIGDYQSPDWVRGWLQVSGAYRLTKNGIVGRSTPEYRQDARRPRRAARA